MSDRCWPVVGSLSTTESRCLAVSHFFVPVVGLLACFAFGCDKEAASPTSSNGAGSSPISTLPASSSPVPTASATPASPYSPSSPTDGQGRSTASNDGGTGTSAFSVKLERTACYGSCPVYSVELEGDGRVTYRGQEHVKVKGAKSKTIPRASVDALAAKVESLGYFDLTWKDPCDRVATDSPTVTTTVTAKGRTRKIVDYRGDRCIPQGLRDFEDEIDRVLGMAEWTKCGTGPCTD